MTYLLDALHAGVGEFIRLRRDIHRHPELAFEEHRTAALVADKLKGWGYEVERGIGGTGVVGRLVRGDGTRRLGLRADMDALPIMEATGAEWASSRPGVPQGQLVLREGAAMASSDYATITLTGVGGHGVMPHRAADPVVAAAGIVMALQTIVSRNVDPLQMAVVTVGAIHAGQANNVIPAGATLELSVRALDRDVRATLERRIKALAAAQAESFGVTAQIDWRPGYAVLVNSPDETAFARTVALELLGEERVNAAGPCAQWQRGLRFHARTGAGQLPACRQW